MVEGDIIASIGEPAAALLDGMIEDLVHAGDIGARADDGRQVLQRALQRIIQPGRYQQEHKEGQDIQAALDQKNRTNQRDGGNAQLQDQRCRHHKGGKPKFIENRTALHRTDFLFQPFEVFLFRVVGLQVANRFDTFLNPIGTSDFYVHSFLIELFLHPCGKTHNGKSDRHDPECGKRHAPVNNKQTNGNQNRGNNRSGQFGDKVGKALL